MVFNILLFYGRRPTHVLSKHEVIKIGSKNQHPEWVTSMQWHGKEFRNWRTEILMARTNEKSAQSGWQTYIWSSKTTKAQNHLSKWIYIPPTFNVSWIIGTLKYLAHNNVHFLHMTVSDSIWLLLWHMYWFVQNFSVILENSQFRCSFSYDRLKKTTSTKMSCRKLWR